MTNWKSFSLDESLPLLAGCYAVYLDGVLSYVGQSSNVRDRLLLGHGINFSRYSMYIDTPWGQFKHVEFKIRTRFGYGEWLACEARLIRKLQPCRNRLGVSRG